MSIHLVPDDCLLHIFYFINDIHTLFKCLRVCKRWYYLVSYRLARAERLLDDEVARDKKVNDAKSLSYFSKIKPLLEEVLSQILIKSPKLKVVSVGFDYSRYNGPGWLQKSIDRLSKHEPLEGLVLSGDGPVIGTIPQSLKSLSCKDTYITKGYYPSVRHLLLEDNIFVDFIHRFPNVEWLRLVAITTHNPHQWFLVATSNQHLLKNLKMLEINTTYVVEKKPQYNLAAQFIKFCPMLESAHLKIPITHRSTHCNFVHKNLTNLVITYADFDLLSSNLANLIILLQSFPNVKHFAIKLDDNCMRYQVSDSESDDDEQRADPEQYDFFDLDEYSDDFESDYDENDSGFDGDDEEVPFQASERPEHKMLALIIVTQLKKLVLLDLRSIIEVGKSTAESVQSVFRRDNRLSAKFYYGDIKDDEIKRDWPELFDENRDTSAFKFMSKHFLPEFPASEAWQLIGPDDLS